MAWNTVSDGCVRCLKCEYILLPEDPGRDEEVRYTG